MNENTKKANKGIHKNFFIELGFALVENKDFAKMNGGFSREQVQN